MSINSIAFLSNTITKPFERFLQGYTITHFPLDTIISTLYSKVETELLIILLDESFFAQGYEERFVLFKNALLHFRANNSAKLLINSINAEFYEIYTPQKVEQTLQLAQLNAKIATLAREIEDCALLDFFGLCKRYGSDNLINEKNRYLFQTPFTKLATELLSAKIEEVITLFSQPRVKAIAVDADNTLWGGIVGEDGVAAIACDNNYPGIIYTKFQEYLLALKNSGIILILLSKNDESLVREVFQTKTMPLHLDDFVARGVNWNPKSENLAHILEELKLTKTGIIFLDDSDAEIAEMEQRMQIPCYKMHPADPLQNLATLANIVPLKTLHVSEEDRKKTLLYKEEKERMTLSASLQKRGDFIASLKITIFISKNEPGHIERITQLINKTNQFNLTTKRYELSQVKTLMQEADVYDFHVKDRFGDMGIVGVVIIQANHIDTFLMSCRVLGRGIEECILKSITQEHPDLSATYCKTKKNALVEHFYDKNGFKMTNEDRCKHYKFQNFADVNRAIKVEYGFETNHFRSAEKYQ